jgi:protein-L-isoaspartate(D-aspartate) O-methyltransferase
VSRPGDLVRACRQAGVRDLRLLEAIGTLPRAVFVPPGLERRAYLDRPLPISHGQVTTQPSLVARMVEALALRGTEKVLEVGTGYGYQTALLANLAREVWSIELWPDMQAATRTSLLGLGIGNANLVLGDGSRGLGSRAPFDAVIVAAAFPTVPPPLVEQLSEGGRLVQPIGPGGFEDVRLFEKRGRELLARRSVCGAHFVRLRGEHGYALEGAYDEGR